MTSLDWSTLTPRQIRDALRTAPRVLTAWRPIALAFATFARCEPLDDAAERCDLGSPVAWVRQRDPNGSWDWSFAEYTEHELGHTVRTHIEGTTPDEASAKSACDAALRAAAYVLDDEVNP